MLQELFEVIEERKDHPRVGSYTADLFRGGEDVILQKIGEEAIEVIVAAKGQGDQRLVEETADLLYHVLVMLSFRGLALQDVEAELRLRHQAAASSQDR